MEGPGSEQRGNAPAVQAFVPLGEMFGYATDLRSSTQGQGATRCSSSAMKRFPKNIEDEIVEHRLGEPVSRCVGTKTPHAGYIPQVGGKPA